MSKSRLRLRRLGMSFNFELPIGWEVKTVEQLVNEEVIAKPLDGNHGGIHPKSKDYVSTGVPFVMASDLDEGRVNFSLCKFITEKQAATLKKGFAKEGDVLLSHKATIGRTALLQESQFDTILLTPQVTYYRVLDNQKLSNIYLKAYFDSHVFQSLLKSWAGDGTTRAYLGITAQKKLPIILPPISIQNKIATQVANLNNRIELNRTMNQTLEKIAQRIFKSWFIDFDPVKANKEGVPFDGLSPNIQALFPSEFEDSELGMIPKGWRIQSLSKVADFLNGIACQKYPAVSKEDALPVIKIAEMRSGYTPKTNEATNTVDSKYIVEPGDFLFSWSGSLTTCFWGHSKGVLNQHLFKVTSENYPQWFYAHWVNYHLAEFIRIAADKATTMGHIKRGHLDEAKVLLPPEEVLIAGSRVIAPLLNKLIQNQDNTRVLIDIRDRLLPKLISGQISVGKAKQELAEAV